jgi:hypothetical protein
MGGDDEFDDFLQRRRRLFGPPPDEDLEPPAEVDRLVLRKARAAIEPHKAPRMFRAPPWSLSVGLAATLVLAFSVILHTAKQPVRLASDVAVQTVARDVEAAAPAAVGAASSSAAETANDAMAPAAAPAAAQAKTAGSYANNARSAGATNAGEAVVGLADARTSSAPAEASRGLVSEAEANRHAEPPPAGPAVARAAPAAGDSGVEARDAAGAGEPALAKAGGEASWRRDSKTWLAEIERLRASGDVLRADAELAEFKRQHRAYATDPNR